MPDLANCHTMSDQSRLILRDTNPYLIELPCPKDLSDQQQMRTAYWNLLFLTLLRERENFQSDKRNRSNTVTRVWRRFCFEITWQTKMELDS